MEIVIKGGMYDRKRSESEKVFQFNGENTPFFKNFDPRSINAGNKSSQAREYTYIVRTTEEGFEYGIHFLNVEYGPRRPAVAIFIRAGWMIPDRGDILIEKLNEMAQKTMSAIAKYVDGYDSGITQGPFQNPLSDLDFNKIKEECDFIGIDKIALKDELTDRRIFLTQVPSIGQFFENPYQKGQISSRGTIWSAWNDITSEKFPNDIVKRANISKNYLYQQLGSELYSLRLPGGEVKINYSDPITNRPYPVHDKITGADSMYLKYSGERFVRQKTAEEAGLSFKYNIKINWTLEGAFGYTKKTHCLQTSNDILTVDYKDIYRPMELTCPDGEKTIIEITENDIKRRYMNVKSKAVEEKFIIEVSGHDFKSTKIKIIIDSASDAYETIKKISYNQRQAIDLSKANKEPRDYKRLFKKYLLIFALVALILGVIILIKSLFFETSENTEEQGVKQSTQILAQNNVNKIEEDKKYFKNNDIWKLEDLKTEQAKAFYQDVLDWNTDKIINNKDFGDYANNDKLKRSILDSSDQRNKSLISEELKKTPKTIDLLELRKYIEKINLRKDDAIANDTI